MNERLEADDIKKWTAREELEVRDCGGFYMVERKQTLMYIFKI